jgi:hypothetical protein
VGQLFHSHPQFNLGLIELSQKTGISVIDIEPFSLGPGLIA